MNLFRGVLLFALTLSSSFASINHDLLKVESALMPKVILMDYNYKKRVVNNSISFVVLYSSHNYVDAKKFKQLIENKYSSKLATYNLHVTLCSYNDFNNKPIQATAIYLLPTNSKDIKKSIAYAQKNSILTFSYSEDDLSYGALISVRVDKRVKPIINPNSLKSYNIEFRAVLLKISDIYKGDLKWTVHQ